MQSYYDKILSAEKLMRVYEIAPPRVRQYLDAEVDHVLQCIRSDDTILELGCGYGRILPSLARKSKMVIGIDTSLGTLLLGHEMLFGITHCRLLQMNAIQLAFSDFAFDCVVCIQNGISAFHVDQQHLIRESIRVTKPGGIVLFSSYSDTFWKNRLEWFRLQAEADLLGEIDDEKTKNGMIVCKDGFTATTVNEGQFESLTRDLNVETHIVEVDESSLFCEIIPH